MVRCMSRCRGTLVASGTLGTLVSIDTRGLWAMAHVEFDEATANGRRAQTNAVAHGIQRGGLELCEPW